MFFQTYKQSKCFNYLNHNLLSFIKIGLKCEIITTKTLGEYNLSIYHDFHKIHRNQSTVFKKKKPCKSNSQVILLLGQSNAANAVKSYNYENLEHLNYYEGNCYILDNPVLGATGSMDNIAPAISKKLGNKKNYIFMTHAWSGTTILDWGSDKFSYLTHYTKNELSTIERLGHSLAYIIWIQGESDSSNLAHLDKGQGPNFLEVYGKDNYYFQAFQILQNNILDDPIKYKNVKIILTTTSICNNKANKIITNQQKLIAKENNIYLTKVTDSLDDKFRYKRCHLNEKGVEKTSAEIANLINSFDKI